MRTTTITVTPQYAAEVLASQNDGNRPVSKARVSRYANEMRRGRWLHTHQGIAFDVNGRLLDGQHRLAAVVEAGVDVVMQVTHDADPKTFGVIDTMKTRSLTDILVLGGYPTNASNCAAVLRMVAGYRLAWANHLGLAGGMHQANATYDDQDWLNLRNEVDDVIEEAVNLATRINTATGNRSVAGVSLVMMSALRSDPIAALEFGSKVVTPVNIPSVNSPVLRYNKWKPTAGLTGNGLTVEVFHATAQAWTAYLDGRGVRTISGEADGGLPDFANLR